MNERSSSSSPSEKRTEEGSFGKKSMEGTVEVAEKTVENITNGKGEKKSLKETFGFLGKVKKAKVVSIDTEVQTGNGSNRRSASRKPGQGIGEKYKNFCYRFGIYFDKRSTNTDLAKTLYQADVEITPGMFLALGIISSLIVSVTIFLFSFILFYGLENSLAYIFGLTFLTLGLSAGGFPFALYNKVSNKNMNIQQEIPFAISYMSVLASRNSPPLDIIRRVASEDYGEISKELSKVIYRIDVLGEDAITAMSYLIQNTSSEHLRAICIDISNAMQAGGGLRTYLELKSKELMEMRRQAQKAFIDSLSIYGEGYLSGIVMSVVLVTLMIVISSALGLDLKIMTARQLFDFFVYFALPFINLMFLLMLWMKYSRSVV